MKRKAFIRYVEQNPELKQWLKMNREWIEANPQAMKVLMNRWYAMSSSTARPRRERRRAPLPPKIGKLPKMDLDKISETTEQLMRTLDMFDNVKNIMSMFSLR